MVLWCYLIHALPGCARRYAVAAAIETQRMVLWRASDVSQSLESFPEKSGEKKREEAGNTAQALGVSYCSVEGNANYLLDKN